MMDHTIATELEFGANAEMGGGLAVGAPKMKSVYRFECVDAEGNVRWSEEVSNLVTDAGINDLLDKYFKGSAYTAAFYVGLKGTGTPVAADTLASHGSWSEVTAYTGNRKALTLGSVASKSVDNSASPASFAINGSATVFGGFVCTAATGTSGVLYGVADFGASRAVLSGDTLNVTVTLTGS